MDIDNNDISLEFPLWKYCGTCDTIKLIDYFPGLKVKLANCKDCRNANNRKKYIKKEPLIKIDKNIIPIWKYCKKCELVQLISEFHGVKSIYSVCKTCCGIKDKARDLKRRPRKNNRPTKEQQKNKKRKRALKNYYKYKNDLHFSILHSLRTRIYDSLKNNRKSTTTENLLGCSMDFFIKWLKWRFNDKMNKDNYGTYIIGPI